jgi:hypothetical protein
VKPPDRVRLEEDSPADAEGLLSQQRALAFLLQRAGQSLEQRSADPTCLTEAALMTVMGIRTWLERGAVLQALRTASRADLERWQEEVAAGEAYFGALREALQAELHLALRERNRGRPDLAP